jgi:integrase
MAWSRKSKQKGERIIRRKLADGTEKTYRYAKYRPMVRDAADTMEALVAAYLASPEWAALAPNTKAGRGGYLKPLAGLGAKRVGDVSRRDIIAMHDAMKGIGNGAAAGFLMAAKALFAWAIDKEWIDHPPTIRIKKAPGKHLRAWTAEEADAAERGLPEYLRRVVVLARHTGQRRGDLCALTWNQYDGAKIRLMQEKTGMKLIVPCAPELRAELDRWKAEATSVTILENAHHRPWLASTLSKALPAALARIGLSPDLVTHGLRKLAGASLAQAGCTPHHIMSILGHRSLAMAALYTASVDQEQLADAAVIRLEAYRNNVSKTKRKNEKA